MRTSGKRPERNRGRSAGASSKAERGKASAGQSRSRGETVIPCPEGLCIRRTPRRGRGVFALRRFRPDETIEIAPVLLIPDPQHTHLHKTELKDYYFKWGNGHAALALGFGSLYNHASDPNAEFLCHPASQSIRFTAARTIRKGEEITIDYDCPLWFKEH